MGNCLENNHTPRTVPTLQHVDTQSQIQIEIVPEYFHEDKEDEDKNSFIDVCSDKELP